MNFESDEQRKAVMAKMGKSNGVDSKAIEIEISVQAVPQGNRMVDEGAIERAEHREQVSKILNRHVRVNQSRRAIEKLRKRLENLDYNNDIDRAEIREINSKIQNHEGVIKNAERKDVMENLDDNMTEKIVDELNRRERKIVKNRPKGMSEFSARNQHYWFRTDLQEISKKFNVSEDSVRKVMKNWGALD